MASSSATVEVFEDVGPSSEIDQELQLELQLETETAAPAAPAADLHSSDANPDAPVAPAPEPAPAPPSDRSSDGRIQDAQEGGEHDEQSPATTDTSQQQPSSGSAVHAHRVNHNSSKLPAFRLSDRTRSSLPLPGLLQRDGQASKQHPPSSAGLPESPQHQEDRQKVTNPAPEPENRPGTNANAAAAAAADDTADAQHHQHHQNHHLHRPVTVSAPSNPRPPPSTPNSPVTPKQKPSPARSRASTYQTASTSAPFTPTAAKRPASFPVDNSPGDALAFQSPTDESSCFWTPETRPPTQPLNLTPSSASATSPHTTRHSQGLHSPETTTKKWAQGQRALKPPAAVNGDSPHDSQAERRTSTSRPPVSYKPIRSSSTPSRPVIPPIRSFRSSGSRKSLQLDMSNSPYRSYDDGHDSRGSNHRDESLRALEGRESGEWSRDMSAADADDEVTATIESESTADIFMRIAHEDPSTSSSRPRNGARDEDDRGSTLVSNPLPSVFDASTLLCARCSRASNLCTHKWPNCGMKGDARTPE